MVHGFASQVDLQISEHVNDQVAKHDQTRHRHDGLLADRRVVESRHYRAHCVLFLLHPNIPFYMAAIIMVQP